MKRFAAAMATAALLGLSQASAQPFVRPGFPGKGPPPGQPMRQMPLERQMDRPMPPERPPYERMSPEERRQLRHDIEQHGREIYPDRRREVRR